MKDQNIYIKQLQKQGNVKSHFKKLQQNYSSDINMAIYMDLDDIQKKRIFDIIKINQKNDFVVNLYGFRMNLSDDFTQKLYKLFIRQMDAMLRNQTIKKYWILLFDSSSEKKMGFDIVKDFYKRLPAIYFVKLNKIYDIQPNFLTKSFGFLNFTAWSKLFYKHVEYVENIQDVQQISQLKIYNILCKCPKQITKGVKIQTQTQKMATSGLRGNTPAMRPKPFDILKRQFRQYDQDQKRGVPLILSILVETMKEDISCCLVEGIFRSAASIEDQQCILDTVMSCHTFYLLEQEEHCKRAISGVIKKIFTQSSTPLIPYEIYNQILNDKIQEKDVLNYWKNIISRLPRLNLKILCYFTQFLREHILQNKQKNKMNAHNLSVVFTPCFFRSKQCTLSDLINSGKFAALFKGWLEKYQEIVDKKVPDSDQKDKENDQQCCFFLERDRKNVEKIIYQGGLRSE